MASRLSYQAISTLQSVMFPAVVRREGWKSPSWCNRLASRLWLAAA
jgi:hypothetical protein